MVRSLWSFMPPHVNDIAKYFCVRIWVSVCVCVCNDFSCPSIYKFLNSHHLIFGNFIHFLSYHQEKTTATTTKSQRTNETEINASDMCDGNTAACICTMQMGDFIISNTTAINSIVAGKLFYKKTNKNRENFQDTFTFCLIFVFA